jgi:hypothetical protein
MGLRTLIVVLWVVFTLMGGCTSWIWGGIALSRSGASQWLSDPGTRLLGAWSAVLGVGLMIGSLWTLCAVARPDGPYRRDVGWSLIGVGGCTLVLSGTNPLVSLPAGMIGASLMLALAIATMLLGAWVLSKARARRPEP